MSVDCSPEARAERQRAIKRIEARLNSGVQSVSDRSRSVAYQNADALRAELRRLRAQEAVCDGVRITRTRYVPLTKVL